MVSISKVSNTVLNYGIKKPVDKLASAGFMNKVCKEFRADNIKFITGLSVGSMILKDGLGCILYVKQSLNNKDIPDDKRKFVAALDLTNGGLMILSQLLMALTISNKKVQDVMFNKVFGKLFDKTAKKGYEALLKNKDQFKKMTGKEFTLAFDKFRGGVKNTFGIFTTLVASTVLAKRVIVPFISTPLADIAKKHMGSSDKKETNTETK